MNDQPTNFLEETPGNKSAMRLMCVSSFVVAVLMALALPLLPLMLSTASLEIILGPYVAFVWGFLASGFAGKVVQKPFEKA
jgi:hypothetical protein